MLARMLHSGKEAEPKSSSQIESLLGDFAQLQADFEAIVTDGSGQIDKQEIQQLLLLQRQGMPSLSKTCTQCSARALFRLDCLCL